MHAAVLLIAGTLSAAEFSTYIGDANSYHIARVVADAAGNTYVAGNRDLAGPSTEVFVMKLDGAGAILLFATLSGKGSDTAQGLALDSSGNIYVAGTTTSLNFPLRNAYQSTPGPGFVAEFNPDATQLLYSTYFPAAVNALAVDSAGNAYLTGSTFSPTFPVTPGLPAGPASMFGTTAVSGAFLTKISATGDRILYSGLIVGHNKDCGAGSSCFLSARNTSGVAIAVDPTGGAYIAGNTDTNDLPVTSGALLSKGTGAFVAKVNAAGTALSYLTYIGPTSYPFVPFTNPANNAKAIVADAAGNAYVAGSTFDPVFPATNGAYQTVFDGPSDLSAGSVPDAFVLKLDPAGATAIWGTYIGGSGADVANALSLDSSGSLWVAGTTTSPDFPNAQGWSRGGDFVVELNATGSLLPYAARFPNDAAAQSISADPAGLLHVAGPTGLVSTIAAAPLPAPRIFGITNAAAGNASGRISPGEVIAIYGPHIGAAGSQVLIGGLNAPVLYVSDSQINAIVPFDVVGRSTASVQIVSKATAGPGLPAGVDAADPEVFRNPDGYATALNQDGTLNSPSNPAAEGSVIAIWATGTGYSSFLDGREGQVVAGAQNLYCCQVTVMESPAEVLYGGTAPGLVGGVMQVNFRLPLIEFFAAQSYLEFTLQAGGQASLPVRVYVTQ